MSLKTNRTPFLQPIVPSQEPRPMSFHMNRTLDALASILIIILTLSTGAATAVLHA